MLRLNVIIIFTEMALSGNPVLPVKIHCPVSHTVYFVIDKELFSIRLYEFNAYEKNNANAGAYAAVYRGNAYAHGSGLP